MKTLSKMNVEEAVYTELLREIKDGIWKNGDKLPSETELCRKMQVSRSSVRSAIQRLRALGVVEVIHGKGTYVAATNKDLMREEQLKEVEHDLEQAIMKGRRCGLNDEEIRNLFEMIMED